MARRLRLFLPHHEPDFGRDIALRCLRQVQEFNARSFAWEKSHPQQDPTVQAVLKWQRLVQSVASTVLTEALRDRTLLRVRTPALRFIHFYERAK